MTNEMQLAHAAGLPMTGHELNHGHGNGQHAPQTGFKRVHKLLRGRYPLVITLGLIFGVAGALTGFLSQKPLYSSGFQIVINPIVRTPGNVMGDPMLEYDRFLQSQISIIRSYDLIQRALDEDDWRNADGPRGDEAAVSKFWGGLEAENFPAESSTLRITYSDPDKDLAFAGAQAILKAYTQFLQDSDPISIGTNLQEIDRLRTRYSNDLMNEQQQMRDLQNEFHTDDLSAYQTRNIDELGQIDNELTNARMQLHMDETMLGGDGSTSRPSAITQEEIASSDGGVLNGMLKARSDYQRQLQVTQKMGAMENSPAVQSLTAQIQVENDLIQNYIQSFSNGQYRLGGVNGGTGVTSLKGDTAMLKVKIHDLEQEEKEQQDRVGRYGQYAQIIDDLKTKIENTKSELNTANQEYDRVSAIRDANPTQMTVTSNPVAPTDPSTDRRRLMAGVGFMGGAVLPTLVVMLISVLDGRFRYSDEANADMGGIPLLGILPNLPDLLTDPTQAATAAHCVHQIRTILQITGHSTERRVFAITSGSPGDGKTSLTLALGLSFAASGSRTLLVDGDLIGGGLTARLNVNAEHGVLESMASRDITPFIRTTDVADLSFLPVGRAMGGYTGTISPAAVRRLVDEARKQFDVILIDTGPILGSIEASPVAVAADGVVLCVSRGQQRQLVDRALAHMHAIGAKLAGVVFNRAQAHDFERSTNRLGLSSIPAGADGRRSEAIGPVARAVASSVRSAAGGNDR